MYFHHISLAFDQVIPLKMCMLLYVLIPGIKLLMHANCCGWIFVPLGLGLYCVNHDILLDKLAHHGVVGGTHAWLESYLCGCQQAIKFDGSLSA